MDSVAVDSVVGIVVLDIMGSTLDNDVFGDVVETVLAMEDVRILEVVCDVRDPELEVI